MQKYLEGSPDEFIKFLELTRRIHWKVGSFATISVCQNTGHGRNFKPAQPPRQSQHLTECKADSDKETKCDYSIMSGRAANEKAANKIVVDWRNELLDAWDKETANATQAQRAMVYSFHCSAHALLGIATDVRTNLRQLEKALEVECEQQLGQWAFTSSVCPVCEWTSNIKGCQNNCWLAGRRCGWEEWYLQYVAFTLQIGKRKVSNRELQRQQI